MFRFLFSAAVLASLSTSALATCLEIGSPGATVDATTPFDCIEAVWGEGPQTRVVIEGGAFEHVVVQDAIVELRGGLIGGGSWIPIVQRGGRVEVWGGALKPTLADPFRQSIDRNAGGAVVLHGFGFQIDPYKPGSFLTFARGWLADRSYVELAISRMSDEPLAWYPITSELVGDPFDPDRDGDFDVDDMNLVRNNFGGSEGDLNGDGTVDISELNTVRNLFGSSLGQFRPVPEPPAALLVVIGLLAMACLAYARRGG